MNFRYLALCILCNLAFSEDKICSPNFEMINLNESNKFPTLKILQSKIEEKTGQSMVIPNKDSAQDASSSLEDNLKWAKSHGCNKLLLGSLSRLDQTVNFSVRFFSVDSSKLIFSKNYTVNSPNEINPTLSKIADKISEPYYSSTKTIYDISNDDEGLHLKFKKSSFLLGLGVQTGSFDTKYIGQGFGIHGLWDNGSLISEIEFTILLHNTSTLGEPNEGAELMIRAIHPFNDFDQTFYAGFSAGIYNISYYNTDANDNEGLKLESEIGYLIGRSSYLRFRGEAYFGIVPQNFNGIIPIEAGLRFKAEI